MSSSSGRGSGGGVPGRERTASPPAPAASVTAWISSLSSAGPRLGVISHESLDDGGGGEETGLAASAAMPLACSNTGGGKVMVTDSEGFTCRREDLGLGISGGGGGGGLGFGCCPRARRLLTLPPPPFPRSGPADGREGAAKVNEKAAAVAVAGANAVEAAERIAADGGGGEAPPGGASGGAAAAQKWAPLRPAEESALAMGRDVAGRRWRGGRKAGGRAGGVVGGGGLGQASSSVELNSLFPVF